MKGLYIKDCRLMINQRQTLLLILLIDLFIALMQKDANFVMGYTCIIVGSVAISTLSFDSNDNGYAFLFTLPFSRTEYVLEKYVFTFASITGCFLLLSVLATLFNMQVAENFVMKEWILMESVYLVIAFLFSALLIPLHLKYGAEKSRIMLFAVFGGVVAAAILIIRLDLFQRLSLTAFFNRIGTVSPYIIAGIVAAVVFILILISLAASIHVIKKKEF